MKRVVIPILLAFGICFLALSSSAQDAKKLSDADIAKLVVGKWRWEDKVNKATVDMIVRDDKTFKTEGVNGGNQFKVLGTWKIEKGALELTINESTLPGREGVTEVHKIFAIDEAMLKFESKDVIVFKRQK